MDIIVSAAARKDGITFNGAKFKIKMNEKNDGTIEYKHEEVKNIVCVMDKKFHSIFLLRGLYEFFKFKLIAMVWILNVWLTVLEPFIETEESSNWINGVNIIGSVLLLLTTAFMLWKTYGTCKKIWMYHGAEHKVIHALENDVELTLENIRVQPRYHSACGSMLVCFIVLIAIIFGVFVDDAFMFLPLIFAISWEIFCVENGETLFVLKWFYKFGKFVQEKVLTKEPTDEMILNSIKAVKLLVELEQQ